MLIVSLFAIFIRSAENRVGPVITLNKESVESVLVSMSSANCASSTEEPRDVVEILTFLNRLEGTLEALLKTRLQERSITRFTLNSFFDREMSEKIKYIPSRISQHVTTAIKFFGELFSQSEFDVIFTHLAPRLLTDLTSMDNSSWDGGCQDRGQMFIGHLGLYQDELTQKRFSSIPLYFRNFVVLNYLLGCCQNRWGSGSFLDCSFPERREMFALEDWFRNCTSPKTAHILTTKKCSAFAGHTAALVSAVNKARCFTEDQLSMVTDSNQFGILVPKSTHDNSFASLSHFLQQEPRWGIPPSFVSVMWIHTTSMPNGIIEAKHSHNELAVQKLQKTHPFGYIFQLFSFNLSGDEQREVEECTQRLDSFWGFMRSFSQHIDSNGKMRTALCLTSGSVDFFNGKLDRRAFAGLASTSQRGISVKHVYALTNNERDRLISSVMPNSPKKIDIRQPFTPCFSQDTIVGEKGIEG